MTVDCGTTAHEALAAASASRARRHRHRPSRRRAAAAARGRGGQPEPARRDQPARQPGRGRGRLSAGRRRSTARCARPAGIAGAPEPDLLQWLDLVALGTVCDVVPLTGLNRALVAQGIKVARSGANPGLARARRGRRGSASRSTPIISALCSARGSMPAGRVGAADLGARLLATDDPVLAAELAAAPRRLQPRAPRDRGAHPGGGDRAGRGRRRNRRRWSSPRPRVGIPA